MQTAPRPPAAALPQERWNNRALWRLMWPLVVEQTMAVTIGLVDTVMVTSVGESAVSGVSLVDAINMLLIAAFTALATGGAVVVSQYLGRRDSKNASFASKQLVYVITLAATGIMALALAGRGPFLRLVYGHIEPGVMANAQTYFWLSAVSYPFIGLYNAGAALFRSQGNSKVSMLVSAMVNLLNIGGNALFIYGFGWEVGGAALSTLISRAAAAVVVMALLLKGRGGVLKITGLWRMRLDAAMIKRILRIGVPNGLENSMFHIGKLIVARVVSSFGTAAIAGNAIASVIASFITLPGSAISLGILTVAGQCLGARDIAGARKNTRKLLAVTFAVMGALCLMVLLARGPVTGWFGLSTGAAEVCEQCLFIFCIFGTFFWPPSFALPNALRAAGDAKFTMVVSMFSMWVFRVALSYLLAYTAGLEVAGVWLAMCADWIVRGIFFVVRWRRGKWQAQQVV